jgi:hypothetical protein
MSWRGDIASDMHVDDLKKSVVSQFENLSALFVGGGPVRLFLAK